MAAIEYKGVEIIPGMGYHLFRRMPEFTGFKEGIMTSVDNKVGEMRFYPDFIPAFDGEAGTDLFRIIDSKGTGRGLYTTASWQKGDRLFIFTGIARSEPTLHSLQVTPGCHLHDEWVAGLILHSCEPNVWLDMAALSVYALRNIEGGEPITMDYATTEDYLYNNFTCACPTAPCKNHKPHIITGRRG